MAPPTVRSLRPVVLSTLLSSSTLFSVAFVTGVPSASVIDTPLVLSGADDTTGLAADGDEVVADGDADEETDVGCGGVDDVTDKVVDETVTLDDGVDLGEAEVSLGAGLLSAVMLSSSDCRTMGSMWGAYLV